MTLASSRRGFAVLCLTLSGIVLTGAAQTAQYPNYPSETPAQFTSPADILHYERRDVMIPMRDGVKLHTVILLPKALLESHGAKHAGMLLTRTP